MADTLTPVLSGMPDICADLLNFIQSSRKAADPGEYEPFRAKAEGLVSAMEQRARESDVPAPLIEQAKFALVGFLDETILQSNWALRDVWAGNPLQLQYFNEFNAGEEFYTKLESLRNADDPKKLDVLEVYFHCLALGFKGKYADLKGMEKIKVLTDSIGKELRKARSKAEGLSPSWEPKDQGAGAVKEFPVWLVVVACAGLLLILYAVLHFYLGGVADSVIKQVS
ncbi:MAG TPA: type IVB secretion system protein IcmH/DotU [Planctomycetota bacterium]|nr:type IVB secretion system protein IcmH/DotU [Planctomycetota bacterium]